MPAWFLIYVVTTSTSAVATGSVPFPTEAACRAAIVTMREGPRHGYIQKAAGDAVCVATGATP